jgi:hypothetical protein
MEDFWFALNCFSLGTRRLIQAELRLNRQPFVELEVAPRKVVLPHLSISFFLHTVALK